MSETFFEQLGLREPDAYLEVGSGPHGLQTATVLSRFETWLFEQDEPIDAVVVVGDVNSTLAASLAAAKLQIPVVRVEAGLRSFDRAMPEEINRVVTDSISDLLLVTEPSGVDNLIAEGRPASAIRLVGNVMIDVVLARRPEARGLEMADRIGVGPGRFSLWTLHRPSNVDREDVLASIVETMSRIADSLPVVFSMHPRVRGRLEAAGLLALLDRHPRVHLSEPLGYLEFLGLMLDAAAVVTDSGGLQEETTALGIPCLTMRDNTERPITVESGSNTLVGQDFDRLIELLETIRAGEYDRGECPEIWDGRAGRRVAIEIGAFLGERAP